MTRPVLLWLALSCWLLFFAGTGLRAWFTPDDLMNLYGVSDKSVVQILTAERPLANLTLKGLWSTFDFHPRPYRVFCFALLILNLGLALWLIQELSHSWLAASAGCLLFAYHAQFTDLYFNTGTIYDLLCFSFYCSALLIYVRLRNLQHEPRWRESLAIALFAVLAAGSKEMAVTLPLMMAAAEWLYGSRGHWRTTMLVWAACWAILGAAAFHSDFADNPAYRAGWTWSIFQARWTHYTGNLLYRGPAWTAAGAWLTLAACGAGALWLRRRETWWALTLIAIAPLPVLFVPPRSFYAFYLPYFGFCLMGGAVIGRVARLAWPRGLIGSVLATLTLALFLAPHHLWLSGITRRFYYDYEARVASPGNALRRQWPALAKGARVYFAEDPFPAPPKEPFLLVFLCRLAAHDHTLTVDRAKEPSQAVPETEWSKYAAVFRLTHDSLVRVR